MTGRLIRLEVWNSRKKNWVPLDLYSVRFASYYFRNGDIMIGYKEFRLLINGKEEFNTMKVKA